MQPEYHRRWTHNSQNNTAQRQTRNSQRNTARRTVNSRSNTEHQTETHLAFSQATSQAHKFLVLFLQQLREATDHIICIWDNATTKRRQKRTSKDDQITTTNNGRWRARMPGKFMSTPSTRTTDGSEGRSTEGAQSVRLASGDTTGGGTTGEGIGKTTSGTV